MDKKKDSLNIVNGRVERVSRAMAQEGIEVSPKTLEIVKKVLEGRISADEVISEVKEKKARVR